MKLRFPNYRQHDRMDCGPTCLKIISKFYGKQLSLDYIRSLSYLGKDGVSLLGISQAAENLGFHSQGVRLNWEQIENEAPLPCILHWRNEHFVVLYKVKAGFFRKSETKVYISDPAYGLISYPKVEFLKNWIGNHHKEEGNGGVTLLLEPKPEFYNDDLKGDSRKGLRYLLGYLRPHKKFILQLCIATFVGTLLSLLFPFLTQSIVDFGIGNNDLAFITMILLAQLFLTVGQTANNVIRSWIMLHITSRFSISLIASFLAKLMKLPISFFDSKMLGDIMQRIGDHNRIQSFITGSFINIVFSLFTLIAYTFVMAKYDIGILGVFYLGSTFYIVWVVLFLKKRKELDFKRFGDSSANQGNLVQLINGMQEIKLNNCERQKRWEWERIQARLYKIRVKSLSLNQTQEVGSTFIDQTKNIAISFLAAKAVISGSMTLGMMMALQYIVGQLNAPIQQFIGFTRSAQDAKLSLERLQEIHAKEDEDDIESGKLREIPRKISLNFRNMTYQFEGPLSAKVLNKVNLQIEQGKTTAIIGTSGSGKTTLIKAILGFYRPTGGRIELNGVSLNSYSPTEWRRRCGVVMQDGFIFSDTVARNIAISDEKIDQVKLVNALEVANAEEFVNSLPLGINTKIGSEGHGLSSGQKQRILIARAVYKDPDLLILDEATNSLDANNEKDILENMDSFLSAKTVVIIAHRLSTIRKADQIIVLNKGVITESGTHLQLLTQKGEYYELVQNQLEKIDSTINI